MIQIRVPFMGGEARRRARLLHALPLAPPERRGRRVRRFPRKPTLLAAGLVASLLALSFAVNRPTFGLFDSSPHSQTNTFTAVTIPAPTNVTCTLIPDPNILVGGNTGLTVTATVPTGPQYSYALQVIQLDTGEPGSPQTLNPPEQTVPNIALTPTGSTVSYSFNGSEFPSSIDPANQHNDFLAQIVVSLTSAPSWQATGQIGFNQNSDTILVLGSTVDFYGTPTGTTAPSGMPGDCATS
jgi:hypothetical protein